MGLSQSAYISAWISSAYLRTLFSAITFIIPPLFASWVSDHGFGTMDERGLFVLSYFFYFLAATN